MTVCAIGREIIAQYMLEHGYVWPDDCDILMLLEQLDRQAQTKGRRAERRKHQPKRSGCC
jgi:hypothetical protein